MWILTADACKIVRCGWDVAFCLRTWHLLHVCVACIWREPPRKWKAGLPARLPELWLPAAYTDLPLTQSDLDHSQLLRGHTEMLSYTINQKTYHARTDKVNPYGKTWELCGQILLLLLLFLKYIYMWMHLDLLIYLIIVVCLWRQLWKLRVCFIFSGS